MTDMTPTHNTIATVAIILPDGALPTVLHDDTPSALLEEIRALPFVPDTVMTLDDAAQWLATQAPPAGLYSDPIAAKAASSRAARAPEPPASIDGADVRRVRDALGLSRHAFGLRLGYTGNSNTVHKTILRVERGERGLGTATAARFVQLAAEAGVIVADGDGRGERRRG